MNKLPISKEELVRRYTSWLDSYISSTGADMVEFDENNGSDNICKISYSIMQYAIDMDADGWEPVLYCGIIMPDGSLFNTSEIRSTMPEIENACRYGNMQGCLYKDILTKTLVSHSISEVTFRYGILWAKVETHDNSEGQDVWDHFHEGIVVFRPEYQRTGDAIKISSINAVPLDMDFFSISIND